MSTQQFEMGVDRYTPGPLVRWDGRLLRAWVHWVRRGDVWVRWGAQYLAIDATPAQVADAFCSYDSEA